MGKYEVKNEISHRGLATKKLVKFLKESLGEKYDIKWKSYKWNRNS